MLFWGHLLRQVKAVSLHSSSHIQRVFFSATSLAQILPVLMPFGKGSKVLYEFPSSQYWFLARWTTFNWTFNSCRLYSLLISAHCRSSNILRHKFGKTNLVLRWSAHDFYLVRAFLITNSKLLDCRKQYFAPHTNGMNSASPLAICQVLVMQSDRVPKIEAQRQQGLLYESLTRLSLAHSESHPQAQHWGTSVSSQAFLRAVSTFLAPRRRCRSWATPERRSHQSAKEQRVGPLLALLAASCNQDEGVRDKQPVSQQTGVNNVVNSTLLLLFSSEEKERVTSLNLLMDSYSVF